MPAEAAELRERALERRRVDVDARQVSFEGTRKVYTELDLGDALDLDAALGDGADALLATGPTESLNVRRAMALGDLDRGETPHPLGADQDTEA